MDYLTEKWGGAPHKRGPLKPLGQDRHGSWFWGAAGRRIQLGEHGFFVTEQDAVLLIPDDEWWTCAWWIGHPEVELYVDICTPAHWEDGRISHVDMDLDVIRFLDGRVVIDDRDEFEVHRMEYGYPQEIVEAAESAADTVFALISRNESPFDGFAARDWVERARAGLRP